MGIWNLPNRITLGRLVLSVVLFAILAAMQENKVQDGGALSWIAWGLFTIAAGTDWLDGWLARRYGMVTAFGRIMDPFVDKVVVCGSFILLCEPGGDLAPWMVVVVVAREFFVSAIRGFMESQNVAFQADLPGKIKMFAQCIAIGAMLLRRCLPGVDAPLAGILDPLIPITIWVTLATTVYSGIYYARKALASLRDLGS